MSVEIISIGDEIVRGAYPNTNAAYISRLLSENGWKVLRHSTLPDDEKLLSLGVRESLGRSRIVITTGGLGPTIDDLTRLVIAKLFASDFHYDEKVAAHLISRYGKQLASLENQATIPTKAEPLLNEVGTAPGLIFRNEKNILICLPGVPAEMESMMKNQVVTYLLKQDLHPEKRAKEILHFCALNESAIDKVLREKMHKDVEVGIYPGTGTVTVCLFAPHSKDIQPLKEALIKEFATHVFYAESGTIEEALKTWMIQHKKTLALAESCTGGKIAAQLTAIPGASNYFLGSLVTYSNSLKQKILHISEKNLNKHGSVSAETVKEMVTHLLQITEADFGIAVSGIAGPTGGTAEKPVGTIWAALMERGHEPIVWKFRANGNRQKIILMTTTRILSALYRKNVYHISP